VNVQFKSLRHLAGTLPAAARPSFEEGLALVMHRWTALNLAIEHGWGGTSSAAKAEELYANLLEWFYTCKGAPPGLPQPPLVSWCLAPAAPKERVC
jgi:hypothetical protein